MSETTNAFKRGVRRGVEHYKEVMVYFVPLYIGFVIGVAIREMLR